MRNLPIIKTGVTLVKVALAVCSTSTFVDRDIDRALSPSNDALTA
ncbi:hypothetical protein OK016_28705 [Vibrio chagasii]|nr:hypothetical protein [Vibrio chagasii]